MAENASCGRPSTARSREASATPPRPRPSARPASAAEARRATEEGVDAAAPRWNTTAGDVDYERMRGLPMIAPGVQGAQKGSDPLGEAVRRIERQSRGR